jgi:hypothetical protein
MSQSFRGKFSLIRAGHKVFHEVKSLFPYVSAIFSVMAAVEPGMLALIPAFLRFHFWVLRTVFLSWVNM